MSMFRSAADISDSSSSDDDDLVSEQAQGESQPLQPPSQPSREDEGSTEGSDIKGLPDADTESHSNLMTAALLEFYSLTRAADLLNRQHGSHKRYTRESPEVQYLGKKMYSYKSKFLSSHGVLADGVETDKWGSTRQYYRDNLDALGLSALEGLDIADRKTPVEGGGDLVLASKGRYAPGSKNSNLRLGGPVIGPLDHKGHSAVPVSALEDFRLDPGRIPRPLLPSGSSPTSLPLFDASPSLNTMSRYAVEFTEIRVVGRGSFGEVYHVKNHIDGQDYAVKKIPLSQKRLQQLQCGNENQLENIMKEIRTLARLEHANVVRYYGAWIEQNQFPIPEQPVKLEYETQDSEPYQPSRDDSFGVVFENSQEQPSENSGSRSSVTAPSRASGKRLSRSLEDDVESIPRNFDEPTHSQLSTFGASDGDIFTDGFSADPSQLQLQRRNPDVLPAVVLHIQMSLHPIPLSSFLSQPQPDDNIPRRHCYHLIPALKLILNIIAGVDYLHSKGIIHRDLKPANIFLSSVEDRNFKECLSCLENSGTCSKFSHPRIGDFGLVADISHLNYSSPDSPVDANTIPKLNRVVGTEFYCPPFFSNGLSHADAVEQFNYSVDESLDVYALGVIFFELVYRITTKMERQMVLNALTRGIERFEPGSEPTRERPVFPDDFEKKVHCGGVKLPTGETVAESLETCIRGMLNVQPGHRWRCEGVHAYLQGLLHFALEMK